MKTFVYLIVSAGLVLVTACGSTSTMPVDSESDEVPLLSTPVPVDVTDESVASPIADQPSPAVQQKMVDLSRENLSQILKVNIDQVATSKVDPVTWSDASLGCPKIGVMYIQTVTPGFLVRLEADNTEYIYHTDWKGKVVLCPEIRPREPGLR
jgi:hypothetical protein